MSKPFDETWMRDLMGPDWRPPQPTGTCKCGVATYEGRADCDACREAAEQREKVRRHRLESAVAALPERYRWATFAALELGQRVRDPQAIAKARSAAGAERVVFQGMAGSGKTTLASCIARVVGETTEIVFLDAFALATARAHHGLGSEAPDVRRALRAPFLVLDDLGAEKNTPQSAVTDVLHMRHAHQRRTVVTTGYSVDEIEARYGAGICRRVFEGAVVIEMKPHGGTK